MSILLTARDFDNKKEKAEFKYDYSNLVISFVDASSGHIRFTAKNNSPHPNLVLSKAEGVDSRDTLYNVTNMFIIKKMHDTADIAESHGSDLECVIEHTSNDYFSKRLFLCFLLGKSTELWGDDMNSIFDSLSVANTRKIDRFTQNNKGTTVNVQLNSALEKNQTSDKQGYYYTDSWKNHVILLKKTVPIASVTFGSIQDMLNSSFLYNSQTDGLKTDLRPEHDNKIYNISIPTN